MKFAYYMPKNECLKYFFNKFSGLPEIMKKNYFSFSLQILQHRAKHNAEEALRMHYRQIYIHRVNLF